MPDAGPLELPPVPRPKLAEQVARQLLAQIRASELAPGTRMPSERRLMTELGVGRSTMREALNDLALVGAIEIRQGRGAFVAGEGPPHCAHALAHALAKGVTRDLLDVWGGLEVQAAELAAGRRTPADLRQLDAVLAAHGAALADGRSGAQPAARFHVDLAEAAHNHVLAAFVRSVHELFLGRAPLLEERAGYAAWELEQHVAVCEAVRNADRARASASMRAHVTATVDEHAAVGLD